MEIEKIKELIRYGVGGFVTTFVNYAIYFLCPGMYLVRNTIAWIGAVIVSYWINQKYVFRKCQSSSKSMMEFAGLRFVTLIVENGLLFLFVQIFGLGDGISKITISIITVLGNYCICKWKIFKKEERIYG